MIHDYCAEYKNVRIRPLKEDDIEMLRVWRNDVSQTQYLKKIPPITPEGQKLWYDNYLKDADTICFAIDEVDSLKRIVGSLSLYNFQGHVAEIGKLQIGDREARGRGLGGKSFVLAMSIGFQKLALEKIVASVHRENIAAYKSYVKIGFQVVGSHPAPMGGVEDELEITYDWLKKKNGYLSEIAYPVFAV